MAGTTWRYECNSDWSRKPLITFRFSLITQLPWCEHYYHPFLLSSSFPPHSFSPPSFRPTPFHPPSFSFPLNPPSSSPHHHSFRFTSSSRPPFRFHSWQPARLPDLETRGWQQTAHLDPVTPLLQRFGALAICESFSSLPHVIVYLLYNGDWIKIT